jgi:hypothetical protein
MVFLTAGFARVFLEKRLELKSLKRQTKAEEEGAPCPFLLSLRLFLNALQGLRAWFEPAHKSIYWSQLAKCDKH